MKPPDKQSSRRSHLLSDIASVDHDHVQKLAARWMESAEQVLAVAAEPGGREGLRTLLGMDAVQMEQFQNTLGATVGDETARIIQQGPASRGALGALLTKEQKRRFGIREESPEREEESQ